MFNSKKLLKRIGAGAIALVMTLSLLAAGVNFDTIDAKADGVVTATVTYTAQYDGSFKDVKVKVPVSSDTAESYGYEDNGQGVTVLDVMVKMHKDIFPGFSPANSTDYFDYNPDNGWITKLFGRAGAPSGYYKNNAYPANGIKETLSNNDVVEAFIYQDGEGYTDLYTSFKDVVSEDGNMQGKLVKYMYDPPTAPLSNVELGWLNLDTLEIVPANAFLPVKTGNDGTFNLAIPSMSGNYLLTEYDGTTNDAITGDTPLVRTICVDYPASPKVVTSTKSMDERRAIYACAGKYLSDTNPSISYGDFKEGYLIGLGRAGYPVSGGLYTGYYDSVRNYLATHNNRFDSVTECAKVVAALNAIGYDPTNVDGVNITDQLNDVENATASDNPLWAYAYALIALDTKGYGSFTRETYIAKLLDAQLENGAWGWSETMADVDSTGLVLAALAPYYNSNDSVREAVNRALDYLSRVQANDGAFAMGMKENSNSTAMVVLGLSELGIDAGRDSRFIKNGVSAVDALCSFSVDGGGFGITNNEYADDYATYQSYYALGSYFRHTSNMKRLFDMTNESSYSSPDGAVTIIDPYGVLPAQVFITIQRITSGEVYDNVAALIKAAFSKVLNMAVYEIDLFDASNTQLHQLNGKVYAKIRSPFPLIDGYKYVAYRVDGDRLIACDVIIDGEYILIGTNHFSTFVVAEVPADETPQNVTTLVSPPKTGDNLGLFIALIALIIASGTFAIIRYKNKSK